MSEYQYYEFQAIDRPLREEEQEELRKLSSRAEIDEWSFANEYSYGDFRGDEDKVLEQYFDAHLYVANWGTHRLMFRLPRAAVDPAAFAPYMDQENAVMRVTPKYVILSFTSNLEGGDGWIDGEGMLDPLLPLRAQLLAGDLRCLYIAWLSAMTDDFGGAEDPESEEEPPVPDRLKSLNRPLKEFVEFMRVEPDLLAAAATPAKERRTLAQLLGEVDDEEEQSESADAEPEQLVIDLPDPGAEEEKLWREAEEHLETKKTAGYTRAVRILTDLHDRAERQIQETVFERHLGQLVEKHQSKKAFVEQLRKAGLDWTT